MYYFGRQTERIVQCFIKEYEVHIPTQTRGFLLSMCMGRSQEWNSIDHVCRAMSNHKVNSLTTPRFLDPLCCVLLFLRSQIRSALSPEMDIRQCIQEGIMRHCNFYNPYLLIGPLKIREILQRCIHSLYGKAYQTFTYLAACYKEMAGNRKNDLQLQKQQEFPEQMQYFRRDGSGAELVQVLLAVLPRVCIFQLLQRAFKIFQTYYT